MKTHSIQHLADEKRWLEAVAHHLVSGDSTADDIVQDTYLSALESPPEASRSMRGWLARVAKNSLRMSYRSDSRRQRRELRAAVPLSFDGRVAIEEADAKRQLADVVRSLEEPYRSAILLRFVNELSIEGVAASQNVPVGTAGWRIHEGLKRLRKELDERSGGDRRAWLMAAIPALRLPEATPLPGAMTQGTTMTKILFIVLTLAASSLGVAAATGAFSGDDSGQTAAPIDEAGAEASQVATAPRSESAATASPTLRVQRAISAGGASTSPTAAPALGGGPKVEHRNVRYVIKADDSGSDIPSDLGGAADLAQLLSGCFEDLARRKPETYGEGGTASLDLEIAEDDELGSVVAMSEYVDKLSTIDDAEFKECIRESSFVLDGATHLGAGKAAISMSIDNSARGAASSDASGIKACLDELHERNPDAKLDGEVNDPQLLECLSKHLDLGDELGKTCITAHSGDGTEDIDINHIIGDGDCPSAEVGAHAKRIILKRH